MNLHQLKLFHTVARLGSYSRAAEEVRISQPSVSIQVADLERSLGVELFEQLGKRIYLTEAGRILEEYAQQILGLVDDARLAVADVAGMQRGRLRLGASTTPGTYLLPRVIGRYQEHYPQITVSLEMANARRIQERLLRNELDLGIVGWEVNAGNLATQALMDDELVVIVPPAHPLAAAEGLHVRNLRDYRLILRERGSGTREAIEAALRAVGLTVVPAMELSGPEAIKQAVMAGLGITIMSPIVASDEIAAGRLAAVPVRDVRIHRAFLIAYHRDKRLTRAVQAFLEMLHAAVGAPA